MKKKRERQEGAIKRMEAAIASHQQDGDFGQAYLGRQRTDQDF